jgi:hypothetical protein
MRLLMTPARVTLAHHEPSLVSWSPHQPERQPPRQRPNNVPRDREAPGTVPRPAPNRVPHDPHYRKPRRVVHVIDRWRYDGRWWEAHEIHRDYYFLELDGGARLELFREGEDWWAARLTD